MSSLIHTYNRKKSRFWFKNDQNLDYYYLYVYNFLFIQWGFNVDLAELQNLISLPIAAKNTKYIISTSWQSTIGGSVTNAAIINKTKLNYKMQNCNYYNITGGGFYDWIGMFY